MVGRGRKTAPMGDTIKLIGGNEASEDRDTTDLRGSGICCQVEGEVPLLKV